MLKKEKRYINFKVGVIGETEVGKTSLVNNYMGLNFDDPDFTTGIDFSEKVIPVRTKNIKMTIWDVSGTAMDLIPPTANEASAILLVYDLNDAYTLRRIENYYNESLRKNKRNFFIVGCKYDKFVKQRKEYIEKMTELSIKVSNLFEKPLIFCSSQKSINIKKLFKLIICQYYGIDSKVGEKKAPGEPIFIYKKFLKLKKKIKQRIKRTSKDAIENEENEENKENEKPKIAKEKKSEEKVKREEKSREKSKEKRGENQDEKENIKSDVDIDKKGETFEKENAGQTGKATKGKKVAVKKAASLAGSC